MKLPNLFSFIFKLFLGKEEGWVPRIPGEMSNRTIHPSLYLGKRVCAASGA